jgi:hypothetical protein
MSRSPWKVRPTVVRRMLHIMHAEGVGVERIEVAPDGRLVIFPRDATPSRPGTQSAPRDQPTTRTSGTSDQTPAQVRQRIP